MKKRCKIIIKNMEILVELYPSKTAQKIWDNLPITSNCKTWGNEVYFHIPFDSKIEIDAKSEINLGEIVFWPEGKAIAIGFGKTPLSTANEIRLAADCNIWGFTNFDLKKLVAVDDGDLVRVERF